MPPSHVVSVLRAGLACFVGLVAVGQAAPLGSLMPAPRELVLGSGSLPIDSQFSVAYELAPSGRLSRAVGRLVAAWSARTGVALSASPGENATLSIRCAKPGPDLPALGDDESYTLTIDAHHARLVAAQDAGALRGIATLTQLLSVGATGASLPAVSIADSPRFAWRGLLIDVGRHFEPLPVILRNLDGMALVKLNVLHLHLSDDQGFRMESKTHPELQQLGSDGTYYTQEDIRTLIAYASDRCIRVVPEFDIPGHTTSWLVSHPELASAPGPYQIQRHVGVFDAVMDPTNEKTYAFLSEFLGEMAALFPDPFFHIGGDENNGHQWSANPAIQAFIRSHGLKDNAGLQTYFNQRIDAFLVSRGKHVIGWDEILHPDLPRDTVIDSWRGAEALGEAAKMGFLGIMAHGYYIDLCDPTSDHYLSDPIPPGSALTPEQTARILGGEATMWAEWISPETIDSRIWPRTAAIAERLWSPQSLRDVDDMYRRLGPVSQRLTEAGLRHDTNEPVMISHLIDLNTPKAEVDAVTTVIGLLEPARHHKRWDFQFWSNTLNPQVGWTDAARPDSRPSREFCQAVERTLLSGAPQDGAALEPLRKTLTSWQAAATIVLDMSTRREYPALREGAGRARLLISGTREALRALDALERHSPLSADESKEALAVLAEGDKNDLSFTEVPFLPGLRLLVLAAGEPQAGSPAEWRARIEKLVAANPTD